MFPNPYVTQPPVPQNVTVFGGKAFRGTELK